MNTMRELLDELKRLERESSSGPWKSYHPRNDPPEVATKHSVFTVTTSDADARFIAEIRNASPVLIEALETIISAVDHANAHLDEYTTDPIAKYVSLTLENELLQLDALAASAAEKTSSSLAREVGK